MMSGDFGDAGRRRVLFLGDDVAWVRMTAERFARIERCFDVEIVNFGYLAHCWVPRELAGSEPGAPRLTCSPNTQVMLTGLKAFRIRHDDRGSTMGAPLQIGLAPLDALQHGI
jgi:hypothetical protein